MPYINHLYKPMETLNLIKIHQKPKHQCGILSRKFSRMKVNKRLTKLSVSLKVEIPKKSIVPREIC